MLIPNMKKRLQLEKKKKEANVVLSAMACLDRQQMTLDQIYEKVKEIIRDKHLNVRMSKA